jgi:thiamine-phosphate diphosphorylase
MTLPAVYGILDGHCLASRGLSITQAAEALVEGGLRLLQLRWKDTYTREVCAETATVARLCRDAGAVFVINDRADIALLANAGVHTGQDDLAPVAVRRVVGPGTIVGISTHNENQFREAMCAPVDYIALGPVYGTSSKARPDPVVGLSELARLSSLYDGPLVAIGGITRERAPDVWRAGAGSVAVISDLYPEPCTRAPVRSRAEEWIRIASEVPDNEQRG